MDTKARINGGLLMRLTKKCDNLYYTNAKFSSGSVYLDNNGNYTNASVNKLGQLEDIEEELGIGLDKLFEALKNGIYGKIGKKIEHILAPHLSWHYGEIYIFKIKDYGKTWALTMGELEK